MNHETARSLFMDYLYDEIDGEDKQRFKQYLEEHPELKEELAELRQTRQILQQMPSEAQPKRQLTVVEAQRRSIGEWWDDAKNLLPRSGWGKTAFAAAACIIFLLIAGSVAQLHIGYTDNGVMISLGQAPTINEGLTPQQAQAFLDHIREENRTMMANFAEEIREDNREQMQQVVRYVEQQRRNDLQLIDRNLEQIQQASNYRWRQANEFFGEIIQTTNYQENN